MAIGDKIISFWKRVRLKSSDMFTLFKVGIGIKSPTHKLHVKDSTDPIKVEGLQNDTTDPDKFLTIDSNNIVKYRTGAQLASDIEVSIDDLHGAGVDGAANQLLTDDGDGTVTSETKFIFDSSSDEVTLGGDDISTVSIIRKTHSDGDGGKIDIEGGNSGGTNNPGGDVRIYGGKGTGNAVGGAIEFYSSTPTSSGSIAHFVHGVDMKISDQLVHVTGNITLSGTVDGRDVATDGTKLDGIEASADVTDTANVTAAGALMDSELTDLAGVKGVTISTLQAKPSEGAFANGDKTKLDAIEASADVTDTTNVTAAGALMDSELTDLAGVKSLDTSTLATLAGNQTITGVKTFENKIVLDGDRSITADGDGVAVHIDAMSMTDSSTSASGTASVYNHLRIEAPTLLATNANVTTTDAYTLYIKGPPAASTNQTITNPWSLYVYTGNVYFGGSLTVAGLTVTGNVIKDDDGANCILFDSSGNTVIGGNLSILGNTIRDNDNTTCITFDSSGNTTIAGTTSGTFSGNLTGNASGSSGSCTGNAATATALATARAINGVDFDGTAPITITAAGSTLSDTVTVAKGGTGATTLTSNALLTGNGTSAVQAQADLTFSSGTLTLTDGNINKPIIEIKSTGGFAHTGGSLDFITDEGNAGASGDILGRLRFIGDNADQDIPQQTYANIQGKVDVATDGQESGILELQVANHDDDLGTGLSLTGGSENNEIDVTVGLGTSSVTTIAGTLTTGSTAALDNSGLIQVAAQPNITSLHSSIAITKHVKVTLSTANCNALHTTPIELVAAQGANTVIVPTGGMIRVDRALTQSNSASDVNFHYEGKEPGTINQTALAHYRRFMYNESGDRVFHIIPAMPYSEVSQNLTDDVDKAVEISVDSAFTSNCFTSIDIYLTYNVFDI